MVVLVSISLTASRVEDLGLGLLATWMSSLEKCPFGVPCPSLKEAVKAQNNEIT